MKKSMNKSFQFARKNAAPAVPTPYEVQTALKWLKEGQSGQIKEGIPNPSTALVLLAGRKAVAWVDAEDFPRVCNYRWKLVKSSRYFYAQADSCGQTFFLHRLVLPVEGKIHFRDGNSLNCKKTNLAVKEEVIHA
jgi:hypothetical protein